MGGFWTTTCARCFTRARDPARVVYAEDHSPDLAGYSVDGSIRFLDPEFAIGVPLATLDDDEERALDGAELAGSSVYGPFQLLRAVPLGFVALDADDCLAGVPAQFSIDVPLRGRRSHRAPRTVVYAENHSRSSRRNRYADFSSDEGVEGRCSRMARAASTCS